ncbi:hypothetical protein ACFX1X_003894 [Malus domestica]|uniref:Uncharacterized protein n=1 Tax=Malus domestica TaxID=3750 RepID=A0A498IXK3_MALDO|nr:hypothetical protein DVH24_034921 [Malus domestica]RXH87075.1 hypothetical protein DVH24_028575 [Malus domestica]
MWFCEGVARFCRAKSGFWSDKVKLLVAAEEGFTLVLGSGKDLRSLREMKKVAVSPPSREELFVVGDLMRNQI